MTSTLDASENELSVPVDYVPGARGHTILAIGPDGDGAEALAVWRLGPTGRAGGAWVLRFDGMWQDVERVRRIMWLLQGRCLVDGTVETPLSIVDRVADLLPADLVAALRDNVLTVPDLLEEIAEQRSRYADAVEEYRATTKSKIVPLAWPSAVPDQRELADWSTRSQQPAAASPVAAQALALTAALARTAELWQDTEQARYRRVYLRSLGEPQVLPPRWLARLRASAGYRLEPVPA